MDKRFILFILICAVSVPLYMALVMPKRAPVPPAVPGNPSPGAPAPGDTASRGVPASAPADTAPSPAGADAPLAGSSPAAADLTSFPSRRVVLENPVLRLELRSEGAGVDSAVLPAYREVDRDAPLSLASPELQSGTGLILLASGIAGAEIPLDTVSWELVEESAGRAVFRYPLDGGGSVTKEFVLPPEGYDLEVAVTFRTEISAGRDGTYQILGPERIRHDAGSTGPNQRVAGLRDIRGRIVDTIHEGVGPLPQRLRITDRPIAWGGLESNYFAWVIRPDRPADASPPHPKLVEIGDPDKSRAADYEGAEKIGRQAYPYRVGFQLPIVPDRTDRFRVFLGPKERGVLAAHADHGYLGLIDYGSYLGWLVRLFLFLLRTFEALTGSWGLAIILLTVLVKTLLHPVNKRNQRTMQRQQKKMAVIQPEMKAIREKHKGDALRANQEIQKLFRERGVNPAQMFGGCLMIFLQLPIWIGLINTFRLAIELRQAPFLWISDLTAPDHVFELPFTIPFLGSWFNILPVLYVIVTLINQRMMPRSDDPQMQQQQKMMTFMMVAFGFIFYEFASGLMVYFLTSASLGILEQKIIRAELRHEEGGGGGTAPVPAVKPAPIPGPALPGSSKAKRRA